MTRLVIEGGVKLAGDVKISGAKNAALPILAGCLLTTKPVMLKNIPRLHDVSTMIELLGGMGVTITRNGELQLDSSTLSEHQAPYELVRSMRASILVLGPLLSHYGEAIVAFPGGCAIGSRPVDLHIKGLELLGATIKVENGYIHATRKQRLKGTTIPFEIVSVTGTENIMMAAVLAEGVTVIKNAAREPEVIDLANFLISMGANIQGAGSETITIVGVEALNGTEYEVMPDRIEAGTFLAAAVATQSKITLHNIALPTMQNIFAKFKEMGALLTEYDKSVTIDMPHRPKAIDIITAPYPGYPTDMQAQLIAVNSIADGVSTITETIFENRFMHVQELQRMGALIDLQGNSAVVTGIERLHGVPLKATDLRASACLIVAGLAAEGLTHIEHIHHLDRGYEAIELKLKQLGALITREY